MKMNKSNLVSYRFINQEQSLSIINQASEKQFSGCMQVFTASYKWFLYLDKGKLIYIHNSDRMFELIYRKLYHLSQEIGQVFKRIYEGINESFCINSQGQSLFNLDYWAICWLVNHKLISETQAGIIIEEIALEIFPDILKQKEGFCQFSPNNITLHHMPRFCYLDVKSIVFRACNYSDKKILFKEQVELPAFLEFTLKKSQERPQEVNTNLQKSSSATSIQTIIPENDNLWNKQEGNKLCKIVCIDDSPTMLNVINSFLNEDFFTVELIDNPLKSLMKIVRTKPDLILLDISMPNLDGYQLCSWIRKHRDFRHIPVIMVTAKTGFINKAKAKMVGASGYLTKPFTQEELVDKLMRHLY